MIPATFFMNLNMVRKFSGFRDKGKAKLCRLS